jgi:hypothetical protein
MLAVLGVAYDPAMHSLVAAEVWHYWIAFPLVGGAVLTVLALIVGYLVKVVGAKPPRSR